MTEAHDGLLVAAFFDGFDRRILSVHQHLRPQEKEVAVIAGVDITVGIHLDVHETLHGHWSIHINNDATTLRSSQPLPLVMPHPKYSGDTAHNLEATPPFLHDASDQKLDGGKAWERGEWHVVARTTVGKLAVCVCVCVCSLYQSMCD